jgi:hypothetical protein
MGLRVEGLRVEGFDEVGFDVGRACGCRFCGGGFRWESVIAEAVFVVGGSLGEAV